jgi:transposase
MDAAHDDIAALRAFLEQAQARAAAAEAEAARAVAQISSTEALIASLRLEIEKLRREIYGRARTQGAAAGAGRVQLEELEATASEDELAAEQAAAKTTAVKAFARQRSSRKPFPAHLPRERVVVPAPSACACCGSTKLAKLGETITETLESIPRQWKVIQTVREKFTCRECEKITQPPAPFHTIPRGWAGPSLLAMILFDKFGQHQPLNRQCERWPAGCRVSLRPWPIRSGPAPAC